MGKNKIFKFYSSELCYENNGQRACQHTLRYDKQTIGVFANFFDLLVKINSLNLVARLWVRQNKKFSLVLKFPFKRSLDSLNTADIQMLLDKIADPSSTGDIIEQLQYTEEEFVQVLKEQNSSQGLNISKTINKILFDVKSDDEHVECEICQEKLPQDEIDCGCDSIEIRQVDFEGFPCDCPICLSYKHAHTYKEPRVVEEPLYSCECAKCLGQEVDEPLTIIEEKDSKSESCIKGFDDIKPIVIDESITQDYPCHCKNTQPSAQLSQTYFDESLYSCNCVDYASEHKQVEEFVDEPKINVGTLLSNSCKGVRYPISKEETSDEPKTEVLEAIIDESKTSYELPYECFCHECQNPVPSNIDYFLWFKQSQPKQIDYALPYECQCHLCSGQEIELSLNYILAETSVNKEQLEEVSIADEPQLDPIVNLDHLNAPVLEPTTTATNFVCPACQHIDTCDFCQRYKLYLLEALECPGCQKLFADKHAHTYKEPRVVEEPLYSCECAKCLGQEVDEPLTIIEEKDSKSESCIKGFDDIKPIVIDESKTSYELPYECFCHECQNPVPSNLDYFLWFKQSQPKQIDYALPYECQCHLCSGQEIELSLNYILAETSVNKEQLEEVSIADEPIIIDNADTKLETLCNCDHLECDEPQLDPIVNLDHLNAPVLEPTTTETNFVCPACQHIDTCDFCQKYKLYLLEALECPGCQKLFADSGISIEELLKSYFPHISYDGKSHGFELCSLSTFEQECPLAKLKDQKFIDLHDENRGIIYTPEDGVNSGDYDELLEGNVNTKRGYGGVAGPATGQGAANDTSAVIGAVSEKSKPDEEIVLVTTNKTGFWGIPAYVLWFIVFALIAAIIVIVVMFFVFGSGLI